MSTTASQPVAIRDDTPSIAGRGALPTEEAAHYMGLAYGTLKKWRVTGDGPAYVKAGKRIVYLIEDLDDWLRSRRVK